MLGYENQDRLLLRSVDLPVLGNLAELSREQPIYLVFLRHFGCTFSRETMYTIAKQRDLIEADGTRIILVHMGSAERARAILEHYNLDDVAAIPDPDRQLYHRFGLRRARFSMLFGLKVWWRGMVAGIKNGHGIGAIEGDMFQMPGIFVIHNERILSSFVHKTAADTPDYYALASCAEEPPRAN